jgi:hypothetical protein
MGIAAIEGAGPDSSDVVAVDSLGVPADTSQKADSATSEQTSRWYD